MNLTKEDKRRLSGSAVEPVALTIADSVGFSGLSRSAIYRLAAEGEIDIVKHGHRSLVVVASLKRFLASLPRADLHTPRQHACAAEGET